MKIRKEDLIERENKKYICGECGWSYPVEGMLKEIIGLPQKYCDSCYFKINNKITIMTNLKKIQIHHGFISEGI